MINKLNGFFFGTEKNESIGDGSLFYIATFGTGAITLLLKIYTSIN